MLKRPFKFLILAIIFGVPVFWYLFLQFFGENKFELAVIDEIPIVCATYGFGIYVLENPTSISEINQYERLVSFLKSKSIPLYDSVDPCIKENFKGSVLLIDEIEQIRGIYSYSIQEIDRTIVETDLLLNLLNE